jgi:hypothetical protein
MANDRESNQSDPLLDPEDVDSLPKSPAPEPDPADEVPVPIAMSPAEIDERAQVIEALKGKRADELR